MAKRSLGSQLGQLALALVNATLLLAVLLVFGLWLLFGRVQDFAAGTARVAAAALGEDLGGRAEDRAATLQSALASLSTLEGRIAEAIARAGTTESPAVAELTRLRADVQALTGAVSGLNSSVIALRAQSVEAVGDVLYQVLLNLVDKLGPVPAAKLPEN